MVNDACRGWLVFIGRIFLAALFLLSGFTKLMNFSGTAGAIESVGVPFATLAAAITIVLEFGGALLLVTGWKMKWGVYALIIFTALATLFFHFDFAVQAQQIAFLKNLGLIGGLLLLLTTGPGRFACGGGRMHSEASSEGM